MFRLKQNTFYAIMHIIFHWSIDTALATPLKLDSVMLAKQTLLCHMLFRCHKEYTYAQTQIYAVCLFPYKSNFLYEQLFKGTTVLLKINIIEGCRIDGMKTELRIQGLLQLVLYIQCVDDKYEFRYCKHLALVILHAKNALTMWGFLSFISSKHWIIN